MKIRTLTILKKTGIILFLVSFGMGADFIRSQVTLGGYLLESKDASEDKPVYQHESVKLNLAKSGFAFNGAYRYSDLYYIRPSSYQSRNRLAMAELSYTIPQNWLKLSAGRSFVPMVDRALFYDGGMITYKMPRQFSIDAFGGWQVPNIFTEQMFDFDPDRFTTGGKFKYTGIKGVFGHVDFLKQGIDDNGSVGLELGGELPKRITVLSDAVFNFNTQGLSYIDLSSQLQVRKYDQVRVLFSWEDNDIDTTRYYEYLVNAAHMKVLAGYEMFFNRHLSASLDYGLLVYENFVGHLIYSHFHAYDAYIKCKSKFQSATNDFDVSGGYELELFRRLTLHAGTGYLSYELERDSKRKDAYYIESGVEVIVLKTLKILVNYEFLNNTTYNSDQRIFFGCYFNHFKRL
ncbi:MAG: hypothetical protein HQK83_10650 [Fibrobacteria bacterium]|nr:hypothetical protein [Fibrobacteria bacterium]